MTNLRHVLTVPLRDQLIQALHEKACGTSCMDGGSSMEPFHQQADAVLPIVGEWIRAHGFPYVAQQALGTASGKCPHTNRMSATDEVDCCPECGATIYHRNRW